MKALLLSIIACPATCSSNRLLLSSALVLVAPIYLIPSKLPGRKSLPDIQKHCCLTCQQGTTKLNDELKNKAYNWCAPAFRSPGDKWSRSNHSQSLTFTFVTNNRHTTHQNKPLPQFFRPTHLDWLRHCACMYPKSSVRVIKGRGGGRVLPAAKYLLVSLLKGVART